SNVSRSRPPSSLRVKRRTQPTRSPGSPSSISDLPIAGCHFGNPLKSLTSAQTLSAGASITALRYTFAIFLLRPSRRFHLNATAWPQSLEFDRLELLCLLGERDLGRQPLHAAGAIKAV